MTYIDYLNAFHRYCKEKYLPGNAKLLYFQLLALFNEAHWPASLQVDNLRLMSLVDTRTERVAILARDKLVDAGLIQYHKGKKRSPNTYYLLEYTPQKVSEFDSKSGCVSGSNSVPTMGSHIKNKSKAKSKIKTFSSGGAGEARADAERATADYMGARQLDPSAYLGVTNQGLSVASAYADTIFERFTKRTPTDIDRINVFQAIYHQEHDEDTDTWTVTFPQDRIDLLMYAFEQAASAGKPGDWRYINGILARLHQRGITTVEQAGDYDYERGALA